jgi:hypothetical protein
MAVAIKSTNHPSNLRKSGLGRLLPTSKKNKKCRSATPFKLVVKKLWVRI